MIICLMSQKCERNIEMQRQVNFKGEHAQEYVICTYVFFCQFCDIIT